MPVSKHRKKHAQKVRSRAKKQLDNVNGLRNDMEQFKRNLEELKNKSVLIKTNTTSITGSDENLLPL